MSKKTGKYPAGAIPQHKMLATGAGLRKGNTKDLDPNGFGGKQSAGIHKSGTSTGSGPGSATKSTKVTPA